MSQNPEFTVVMHGTSGDLEVFDNPGADRHEIDSWDAAIRAAWFRLGPRNGGWESATVKQVGSWGRVVRLFAADKAASDASEIARIHASEAAYQAEKVAHPERFLPEIILGGDEPDPEPEGETNVAPAIRTDEPRPLVWSVKVHTPLTAEYMRCFHHMYSDPEFPANCGEGWLVPNRGERSVTRIEVAEPEFGRGIVFHVRGTARRAAKEAERMIEAARAEFSPHSRRLLSREAEMDREAITRDAEKGI